jgi:ABC-type glycerol-3-phosphate transport system substrate-binding protein
MKRTILVLVVCLLFNAGLAMNVAAEEVLTVWAWSTAAFGLQDLVPAFEAENPGVRVDVQEIAWEEMHKKLLTVLAAGAGAPDVTAIEGNLAQQYVNGLMDVTDRLEPYFDVINECKLGEAQVDGRIYAIPWDTGPVGIYYRTDIFEEAGIAEFPATWDEFRELGKQLSGPRQKMLAIDPGLDVNSANFYYIRPMLNQLGSGYLDADQNITLNTPEMRQVLQTIYDMMYEDEIALTDVRMRSPAWYAAMKAGRFLAVPGAAWFAGIIEGQAPEMKGQWGVFPMPAWEAGGAQAAALGGSVLAIPRQTEKPDLAWKFVEFAVLNDDSQIHMFKTQNLFPSLETTYDDPYFDVTNEYFSDQPINRMFADYAQEIPIYYYAAYFGELDDMVRDTAYQYLTNQISLDETLETMQTRGQTIKDTFGN